MKRNSATKALALIVIVLILAGCSANPTNRWAQARTTQTAVQDSIRAFHEAGAISNEELVEADPFVQITRATLDRAYEYLPEGGDLFDSMMDAFDATIVELQRLQARAAAADDQETPE